MPGLARTHNLNRVSRQFAVVVLLAAFVGACSSSVTLQDTSIPVPLTEKLPISVGLRLPENLFNFVHEEQVYGREEWSIDLGNANADLFRQLLGYMFQEVKVLTESDDPGAQNLDALIEPSIDAFEFSVPTQSKTDSFAVWVRYRLKVYDSDGKLVSEWPVSAYGKSRTASKSNSEALQRAAVLAMRDAAALIVMKLDSATGIGAIASRATDQSVPVPAPANIDASGGTSAESVAREEADEEPI